MKSRLVLGVSGSIAAYRAADLARDFMRAGVEVRVCLTDHAERFVTPALFEALTGQPCLIDTFEEPDRGRMAHIDWARQADAVLIAPATANSINKLAHGLGDDMLTTLALAFRGPLAIAPAMNPSMYSHETVQASRATLLARGVTFIDPDEGDVACGENGQGKLASNVRIVGETLAMIHRSQRLQGQKVLISSGPTQEPIDDVRFLSNRSSGRMGAAVAQAALQMGADVVVVSGPVAITYPVPARVIGVRTAAQMKEALMAELTGSAWVVGVAAVSDYRPAEVFEGKLRRSPEGLDLALVPNEDLIALCASSADPGTRVVGFAAEPTSDPEVALEKLRRKGLFAIAQNDVSVTGIGFEAGSNALDLHFAEGRSVQSGVRSKRECGWWLWEQLLAAD